MKKIFIYVRKNISFHENNSKKKVKRTKTVVISLHFQGAKHPLSNLLYF